MTPEKVFYSCVIDNHPKFYWQGYIFVNSLLHLAHVSGDRIFIHLTAQNMQFESFLQANNVNIVYIEPWGDKKYCNKLQQLETKALQQADYIWFCDADTAILEDLAETALLHEGNILGKIIDHPNPHIDVLKNIYDIFGVEYHNISTDTLTQDPTFAGNFNGGLYGIPSNIVEIFGKTWKFFAKQMLNSVEIAELLQDKICHIDQISFSLALKKLDFDYKTLGYEYNFPAHLNAPELLSQKLKSEPKVIHYHNRFSNTGLLNNVPLPFLNAAIAKVNEIIQNNFNNSLFWDWRYATNPELGSGLGSRGEIADYKLKLLRNIGLEKDQSILDMGCGDLHIISNLKLNHYTGVDISSEAIAKGKEAFPQFNFYNFALEKENIQNADTVICLDVLIHQPQKENYDEVISFVAHKANKRLIISGYEQTHDSSHMCFYYENIKQSLERTKQFKYIYKIGEYRNLGIYVADKGELIQKGTRNDISNEVIDHALKIDSINNDLFLESVTFSRAIFSWFTKHYPRIYEYPWILQKLGRSLEHLRIADLGAGLTPLPFNLAQRGAEVFTVDSHPKQMNINALAHVNEWGFFDYGSIDSNIHSYNKLLDENLFAKNSLHVWYSVSVVEHMPAQIRRQIFSLMADTLCNTGILLLTLDLVKNSNNLWNMSEGKMVEDEHEHGTLDSIITELQSLGFEIAEKTILHMPDSERTDIALVCGVLNTTP